MLKSVVFHKFHLTCHFKKKNSDIYFEKRFSVEHTIVYKQKTLVKYDIVLPGVFPVALHCPSKQYFPFGQGESPQ
jgi:hypothetical protein